MKQFCSCLLGFALLLVTFSGELGQEVSRSRKLCGRYLQSEIVKLCGLTDWSRFHFEEEAPLTESTSQEAQAKEDFQSPQASIPTWRRFTNPASASAFQKEAASSLEVQSLPADQYEKASLLPDKTRDFSSSLEVSPYVKSVKIRKKRMNKITTIRRLYGGNHPQRKRRGYSEKCCLKGCTKEELAIACLPYLDF